MKEIVQLLGKSGEKGPLTVLCLGAHSDDIEIGCAGTLFKLTKAYPKLSIHWVVLSADGERRKEAEASANELLAGVHQKQVIAKQFRNGYFPYVGDKVKDFFEELKTSVSPDLIFTHCRHDLHQDHRIVCELTWNTFRSHLILEYEILKYDADLGSPNVFVGLDAETVARKAQHLQKHFTSQSDKHWFTDDAFSGLLRIRGLESGSSSPFAEAFYCRKLLLF